MSAYLRNDRMGYSKESERSNMNSSSNDESDDYSCGRSSSADTSGSPSTVLDKSCKNTGKDPIDLPPIEELRISWRPEDEMMPRLLQELRLRSDSETTETEQLPAKDEDKQDAGVVTSVASVVELIVAKPPVPHEFLLYLGSPVFILDPRTGDVAAKRSWVKLGWVMDVFGPACEPYYCVQPLKNGIHLVREGTQIFYAPDHPRTTYVCLKRETGNRYKLLYSPRRPGQKGEVATSEGVEHFRGVESSGRRYRRRRAVSNRRGSSSYENKHPDQDPQTLSRRQAKHLYFCF